LPLPAAFVVIVAVGMSMDVLELEHVVSEIVTTEAACT
jgi:hypothetical protein